MWEPLNSHILRALMSMFWSSQSQQIITETAEQIPTLSLSAWFRTWLTAQFYHNCHTVLRQHSRILIHGGVLSARGFLSVRGHLSLCPSIGSSCWNGSTWSTSILIQGWGLGPGWKEIWIQHWSCVCHELPDLINPSPPHPLSTPFILSLLLNWNNLVQHMFQRLLALWPSHWHLCSLHCRKMLYDASGICIPLVHHLVSIWSIGCNPTRRH